MGKTAATAAFRANDLRLVSGMGAGGAPVTAAGGAPLAGTLRAGPTTASPSRRRATAPRHCAAPPMTGDVAILAGAGGGHLRTIDAASP